MAIINCGVIGLGRMGAAIATRMRAGGFTVLGFDVSSQSRNAAAQEGIALAESPRDLAKRSDVIWLMVPSTGTIIDDLIKEIAPVLTPGKIIIDGGNTFYKDSIRRAHELARGNIQFLDVGTSGGIAGRNQGFCLMVGGDAHAYARCERIFNAVATLNGAALVGPSGAGHYVKMIHNGIEYGLLQAYGEGFQLLREGAYKNLDLAQVSNVWMHGSVIRSWLLELAHQKFIIDQHLQDIQGDIQEGGTGKWTVDAAHEYKIPMPVIEESLKVREWSRKSGGNFATKVVAILRNAFGGHAVTKKEIK